MKLSKLLLVPILLVALGGCVDDRGTKEIAGALVGAGLGGVAGSQIGKGSGRVAAGAAGALIGAMLGAGVGKSLDRIDQLHAQQNYQQTLESVPAGTTSTWMNPDSGNSGTMTPIATYHTAGGQPCREFQQTVTIGGETHRAYGTACREADGSWRIVDG